MGDRSHAITKHIVLIFLINLPFNRTGRQKDAKRFHSVCDFFCIYFIFWHQFTQYKWVHRCFVANQNMNLPSTTKQHFAVVWLYLLFMVKLRVDWFWLRRRHIRMPLTGVNSSHHHLHPHHTARRNDRFACGKRGGGGGQKRTISLTFIWPWISLAFRLAKTWMWLDTCFRERLLPVRSLMYLAINSFRPVREWQDALC